MRYEHRPRDFIDPVKWWAYLSAEMMLLLMVSMYIRWELQLSSPLERVVWGASSILPTYILLRHSISSWPNSLALTVAMIGISLGIGLLILEGIGAIAAGSHPSEEVKWAAAVAAQQMEPFIFSIVLLVTLILFWFSRPVTK